MHQTLLHTHMYITPPLLMARSKCTIRDIPTTNSCIIMCTLYTHTSCIICTNIKWGPVCLFLPSWLSFLPLFVPQFLWCLHMHTWRRENLIEFLKTHDWLYIMTWSFGWSPHKLYYVFLWHPMWGMLGTRCCQHSIRIWYCMGREGERKGVWEQTS